MVVDLDGLLIDSETWSWQAHNEVLQGLHAEPLRLDEVRLLVGLDAGAEWELLGRMRALPVDHSTYAAAQRTAFIALEERSIAPMPGVLELLAVVATRGLRLGLASNSRRSSIHRALDRLDILDRFGAVVSVEDVPHGKPAGDVYALALARLGVAPEAALAIEDSAVGVAAARAAGLYCIAVPNAITEMQDFGHASLRLSSLLEVARLLATDDDAAR